MGRQGVSSPINMAGDRYEGREGGSQCEIHIATLQVFTLLITNLTQIYLLDLSFFTSPIPISIQNYFLHLINLLAMLSTFP
jgi:hypothetical protein